MCRIYHTFRLCGHRREKPDEHVTTLTTAVSQALQSPESSQQQQTKPVPLLPAFIPCEAFKLRLMIRKGDAACDLAALLLEHMRALEQDPNHHEPLVADDAVIVNEVCRTCHTSLANMLSPTLHDILLTSDFFKGAVELALQGETAAEMSMTSNGGAGAGDTTNNDSTTTTTSNIMPQFGSYFTWTAKTDGPYAPSSSLDAPEIPPEECCGPHWLANPLLVRAQLSQEMEKHRQLQNMLFYWLFQYGIPIDKPSPDIESFQRREIELLEMAVLARKIRENMNSTKLLGFS